ncbi:MAG: ABC transporter ATP-binding protein, partial [Bacteroidota bacterium]
SSPSSPYTRGLLACKPGPGELPARLPTVGDFLSGKSPEPAKARKMTRPSDIQPLLEIRKLSTYFHGRKKGTGVKAVDQVSIRLFRGETLGLVGESGCGKTTLGRTILQLIKATSGEIIYNGVPLTGLRERELRAFRKKIQIVFQDPYSSLNPGMTIGRMLTEPMRVHGIGRNGRERLERASVLLNRVGLGEEDLTRYPHQFSGGQRQRIGIARALATDPEFLILDESVSALDVSVQAQVLNLLNDLKDEFGLTYIFISHDLSVVRYMSDRIMVMKEGQMVEEAASSELFENPSTSYTRELLDAIPV